MNTRNRWNDLIYTIPASLYTITETITLHSTSIFYTFLGAMIWYSASVYKLPTIYTLLLLIAFPVSIYMMAHLLPNSHFGYMLIKQALNYVIETVRFMYSKQPREVVQSQLIHILDKFNYTVWLLENTSLISKNDGQWISAILLLRNTPTREVMVPQHQLAALEENLTVADSIAFMQQHRYSYIPIYKGSLDNITGVVFRKQVMNLLLQKKSEEKNQSITLVTMKREVAFIPETKTISSLAQLLQQKKEYVAVVIDEYGHTEGIVLLKDIIETVVGTFRDDISPPPKIAPHENNGWVICGDIKLQDISKILNIEIKKESNYSSLSGYILNNTGYIPKEGARLQIDDYSIEILEATDRYIKKVHLKIITNH